MEDRNVAFFDIIVGFNVSRACFLTICVIILIHTGRIFIRYQAFIRKVRRNFTP